MIQMHSNQRHKKSTFSRAIDFFEDTSHCCKWLLHFHKDENYQWQIALIKAAFYIYFLDRGWFGINNWDN